MYYNWNTGESSAESFNSQQTATITNVETGEEITHVRWCDTKENILCRYELDENGAFKRNESRDEAITRIEHVAFRLEFKERYDL